MYSPDVRLNALSVLKSGRSLNSISKELGIARSTLREWRDRPSTSAERSRCVRCHPTPSLPPQGPYAHLLGLYLGDGCISLRHRGVYALRIACCNDYPRLIDECEAAIVAIRPGPVSRVSAPGGTHVVKCWKHWPCLLPQHGAGRKHTRRIELQEWQIKIVKEYPGGSCAACFTPTGVE